MFNTPILLIVFNRPETTLKVFEVIRTVKPKKLYIAGDGPRNGNVNDLIKCQQVRDIIKKIDWDCEYDTLFSQTNLGCRIAPPKGISWFFQNEEAGIILEDDCLPNLSFFKYCEELLQTYKNNERVMMIAGNNSLNKTNGATSYDFVKTCNIWGWAGWKRAWEKYDLDMKTYDRKQLFNHLSDLAIYPVEYTNKILDEFDKVKRKDLDTWDYQWQYSIMYHHGLAIWPHYNMIKNIGFGDGATHTHWEYSFEAFLKTYEIKFPLKHPSAIEISINTERQISAHNLTKHDKLPFYLKLRNFVSGHLKKIISSLVKFN